jgi:hypothetical protein
MAFRGWPAEAIEFFEGLEADNSKTYWQENKAVYEELGAPDGRAPRRVSSLPQYGEGDLPPVPRRALQQRQVAVQDGDRATLANGGYISLSAEGLAPGAGCTCRRPISSSGTAEPWPTTGAVGSSRRSCPSLEEDHGRR